MRGFGRVPGENRMRLKSRVPAFFIVFAFSCVSLLAQESGGGTPKPDLTLWEWLNFAILAGLLGWIAVKQGGPALHSRSKQIQDGLAAGEKARAEADARAAEVDKRLAGLEREIAAMRATAGEEREREAERIRVETQAEMARIQQQSAQEIESLGKLARLEVQRAAARLAMELAERKVQARMSPELQSALIKGFLEDLPDGRTKTQSNAG